MILSYSSTVVLLDFYIIEMQDSTNLFLIKIIICGCCTLSYFSLLFLVCVPSKSFQLIN
uniref:Uncharacterized protein n=1 Tax=Arundo donax TaxID=35708 RepID=A0A0A8YL19_ARUDO